MIKNITVVGSGTMGNGIAHTFAQNGFIVNLTDINDEALIKAINTISKNLDRQVAKEVITEAQKKETLNNINTNANLSESVKDADLIIEAATENNTIKLSLFKQLSELCKDNAILASNTSSI